MATRDSLIAAAGRLRDAVDQLRFAAPVTHVYNPLGYAWRAHEIYLRRYGNGRKRVLFLGMNPGPFGMAQTGIPFGEIPAVRNWLGIKATIQRPPAEHPKRPVLGFDCRRSEISGQRLWGLFAKRFGVAEKFFQEYLVMNYCPLAFIEKGGRNRTPDKLPPHERVLLFAACDEHLREVIRILEPEWLIGIGDFAGKRARDVIPIIASAASDPPRLGQILHPSPACPASNNDWAGIASAQLRNLGVWK
ncbi:MAG TPA: uracil-DNA glycosylase family protein [Chthoniobacterales bacterium]|nr:uracil-DNA glycosylase family protein [Chthoniobacterales bacterium]